MALTNRFTTIDKAIIVSIGNSLVTCGDSNTLNNNTSDLVTPSGMPTRNWTTAGSTAVLNLLDHSDILYAELTWYSTVRSDAPGSPDLQSIQDNAITFTTPSGTYQITPTYVQTLNAVSGCIDRFRSAIVTDIIASDLSGEYTVSSVPTSIPSVGLSKARAGWSLSIICRHDSFEPKKIIFSSGIVNATPTTPLQTMLTGFSTSSSEVGLNGSLFFACANGQPLDGTETVQVGPSFASLTALGNPVTSSNPNPGTAPNNPVDNFFGGMVNVCNPLSDSKGLLNVSGTNGSMNHDAFSPYQLVSARNKWDMALIDITNTLVPNQNQLALQITETDGLDGIMLVGIGSSVSAAAPDITTTLEILDPYGPLNHPIEVGEKLVYLLRVENKGTVNATNFTLSTDLPSHISFVPESLQVNHTRFTNVTQLTNVNIGTVPIGSVETILFEVVINGLPSDNNYTTNAFVNYDYSFVSGSGSPVTTNHASTPTLTFDVTQASVAIELVPSVVRAEVGDKLIYQATVRNTGSQTLSNALFQNRMDASLEFVPGTVTVNAVSKPFLDPNGGFVLDSLASGEVAVITYQASVVQLPPSQAISNKVDVTFSYVNYHGNVTYVRTTPSNIATTEILFTSLVANRCLNDDYPAIGDIITYTLTITNIGNKATSTVSILEPSIYGAQYVSGSVTIDGRAYPDLNPFTGFDVDALNIDESVTIDYSMEVTTVDTDRLVRNIASVPFQYQISQSLPVVSDQTASNIVETLTSFIDVTITETVDKSYASLENIVYYTVTLENLGNIDAVNTLFVSQIQASATFIPGTVAINGILVPAYNPNDGFTIDTLCPGNVVEITYAAKVIQVPGNNVVYNHSELVYSYYIDPNGSAFTETIQSNTVETLITVMDYTFIGTVDKVYAQVGDIVTFSFAITNTGNTILDQITFFDPLADYLSFMPGQLYINSIQYSNFNPDTGFPLDPINPGDTTRITIGAIVSTLPPTGFIVNMGDFVYSYRLTPTSDPIRQTDSSPEVRIFIVNGDLNINTTVNKTYVTIGDTIIYTLNITNTGNILANNLNFIHTFPTGINFVTGSVILNGLTRPNVDPNVGFPLINLNPGETLILSYSVTVISMPSSNTVINGGSVTFGYLLQPTAQPLITTVTGNFVTIIVNESSVIFTPTVDKPYATVGDTLNYSFVINNTGTVEINNIQLVNLLPEGITFNVGSVIINDVVYPDFDPNNGFVIPPVHAGSSIIVRFAVLISSVPTPNTIINSCSITYEYRLSPLSQIYTVTLVTDPITTVIKHIAANVTKTVDKAYATIGDALVYTSTFTNLGNVDLTSLTFSDNIPSETEFVSGTVLIDGLPYPTYNPIATFDLPDVAPGDTVTVEFQASVMSLPPSGYVKNRCRVEYDFKINPNSPDFSGEETSPYVTTYIRVGKLDITKAADRTYAELDNMINYSFILTNAGNTTLINQRFVDIIQADSSFNTGSVYINSINQIAANPNTGFMIPDLAPGHSNTIYFSVVVNDLPTDGLLKNIGSVDFAYYVDPDTAPVDDTSESNETIVNINDAIVTATKSVDFANAKIDDDLTYSFVISNTGNTDAVNVFFRDMLSDHLEFVPGSVIVNGQSMTTANPNNGFALPTIEDTTSMNVSFKATIISRPPNNLIPNFATVDYEYYVSPTTEPLTGTLTTNTVETRVATGEITVTKSVNSIYSTIDDELSYTIDIKNTGSVLATSVSFQDIMPEGISFKTGSVVVNNISNTSYNPNLSFILPNLAPDQTHKVTFVAHVTSLPASGQVSNFASVTTSYKLTPQDPEIIIITDSNTVTTSINIGILDVTKVVNKSYATTNEELTYSFTVTNTGSVACENINFIDMIQTDASFDMGSVIIGGVSEPTFNPNNGFTLGTLDPQQSTTIRFTVTTDQVPSDNLLVNKGTLDYTYFIDPATPAVHTSVVSNTVQTLVNVGDITLNTSVNLLFATLNDVVIYTVNVTNTGTVNATNVNFRNVIPSGLTFIEGSVQIDGVIYSALNPFNSFTLGTITPGNSVSIRFNAVVTSIPTPSIVTNISTATFSYRLSPTAPMIIFEKISNPVETSINIPVIDIVKSVDKDYATIGDILNYSFVITNNGNIDIKNAFFLDLLESGISFNQGTVRVNNVSQPTFIPAAGFSLGTIEPTDTITITFSTTVDSLPDQHSILNKAFIEFDYNIDPQGQSFSATTSSNTVITLIRVATISSVQTVDKAYATLENELIYHTVVSNTGNTTISDLTFRDFLTTGATFIQGSVLVNGATKPNYNPFVGFDLPDLVSGNTTTISFRALVTSIPTPPVVTSYAVSEGFYKLDPQGSRLQIDTTSNSVQTIVNIGDLTVVKSVDKEYEAIYNTLTYTSVITNTGTVNATNILFSDTLQSDISFITGTVRINNVVNPSLNPTVGLSLANLAPAEFVTVAFDVRINTLPTPPIVENSSQAIFEYKIDPTTSSISTTRTSNTVYTNIVSGNLTTTKSVDRSIATIGDILNYTVTMTNDGNTLAGNVFFQDVPTEGVAFSTGSVLVNGVSKPAFDPTVGFSLDDIAVGTVVIVKFQVAVTMVPDTNQVTNQAVINFDYVIDPKKPAITTTITTNTVVTNIAVGDLSVVKSVNKAFATIGDQLTYTVIVTNIGNINATDVLFLDPTPDNATLVLGSVTVNGVSYPGYNPSIGFSLGTLTPGQIIRVVYRVEVAE